MRWPGSSSSPSFCLQFPQRLERSLTSRLPISPGVASRPAPCHSPVPAQSRGRPIASEESSLRRKEGRQQAGSLSELITSSEVATGDTLWADCHLRDTPRVGNSAGGLQCSGCSPPHTAPRRLPQRPQRILFTSLSKETRTATPSLCNGWMPVSVTRSRPNNCLMTK